MRRLPKLLILAFVAGTITLTSGLRPVAAIDLPGIGNIGGAIKDKVKAVSGTSKKAPAKPVDAAGKALTAVVETPEGASGQQEIGLGRGVAAKMLGAFNMVDDPALQAYVGKVGMHVASRGERQALPWRFVVVDAPAINAFAVPGGIIFITRGLYTLLETEDELAAIIGHEIAHVQRRHHYEVMKQQKLVGVLSDTAASQLTVDNAMLEKIWSRATEVMVRGLDKSAEFEADRDGMVLAARAGYDSSALLTVLEKIGASAAGGTDAALLYSTHPSPAARVAALGEAVTPALEAAALPSPAAPRLRDRAAQAQ
jgi:beta-barrel assembly-enhancing protease